MNRRRALALLGGAAAAGFFFGGRHGFRRLARPAPPEGPLSQGALALVDRAFSGLEPKRVLDTHVHVVGLGAGGTGCFVNPNMNAYVRHPIQYARFSLYKQAAG